MPFGIESIWLTLGGFVFCAALIAVAGTLLAKRADMIADVTGLGEALVGAVLLGGSTSLPGIITSVVTAWQGHPVLSISNAIGGITAQTAFLVVADMFYRRANLEHAAASAANLTQGALLVSLLSIPLIAMSGPQITILGVHPATVLMLGGYAYGVHLINRARTHPMWAPRATSQTQDSDDEGKGRRVQQSAFRISAEFLGLAAITAGAGYGISQFGISLARQTGLAETAVGGLLTAISTSLPELVTSVAAVRAGALTMAVGGIIGGNAFDTLFIAFSDVAYREGSLYHQFNSDNVFTVALAILMTGTLLLGLLRRETVGPGRIGFESVAILILYALGAVILIV